MASDEDYKALRFEKQATRAPASCLKQALSGCIKSSLLDAKAVDAPESELQQALLRIFVCDISDRINNLFMALWGNVTLARMQLRKGHRCYRHAAELEGIIEQQMHLLQLITGFFAERRSTSKNLHLKQLEKTILRRKHAGGMLDCDPLWSQIKTAHTTGSPQWIAGILVDVLERLIERIATQSRAIARHAEETRHHAKKITELTQRGERILKQLRLIAGNQQTKVARMRLGSMLKKQAIKAREQHHGLVVKVNVKPELPEVWANREQFRWMLQQVIDSAVSSMHPEAKLDLRVSCASPNKGCRQHGQQRPRNLVKITIKESRPKVTARSIQNKRKSSYRTICDQYAGLSMAAASSIARTHGGDLKLRSDGHGRRSCTILWPSSTII
jgi:signal transduction histidine kinase